MTEPNAIPPPEATAEHTRSYGFRETFLAHFHNPSEADALRRTGDVLMNYLCESHQLGGRISVPFWQLLLPAAARDLEHVAFELRELADGFVRGEPEELLDPTSRGDVELLRHFAARAGDLASELLQTATTWQREVEEEDRALLTTEPTPA